MTLILLAVVFTTLMFTCFKFFQKLHIDTYRAILVNYITASATGYFLSDVSEPIHFTEPWFVFSFFLGLLFIFTFVATSLAAQKVSLIVSMIASKMSLVIPLAYAVLFIGESMTLMKLFTIALAMTGVVLTVMQRNKEHHVQPVHAKSLSLIIAVFAGSGLVDTSFKYIELHFYNTVPLEYVMMVCYAGAAVSGFIYFFIRKEKKKGRFDFKNISAGIILGILNYFSFRFVLAALHHQGLPSTIVFPMVNVGVLLFSTLIAVIIFRERLDRMNYLGILISILSIVILAWQQYAF